MVWFDILCHRPGRTQFDTTGGLRIHRGGINVKKPGWIVLATGTLGLITAAVVTYIVADLSGLPAIPAWAVGFLVMVIYAVISHKVRPEPNVDNLGWFGGVWNDPFRFSDNINRFLWKLQILLGPGRLIGMGFVDTCTYCGLIDECTEESLVEVSAEVSQQRTAELIEKAEARFAGKPQGVQELTSWRFMPQDDPPPGADLQ